MRQLLALGLVAYNLFADNKRVMDAVELKDNKTFIELLMDGAKVRYEKMNIDKYNTVDEIIADYSEVDENTARILEEVIPNFQPDDYMFDGTEMELSEDGKRAGYLISRLLDLRSGTYHGDTIPFDELTDGVREEFYKLQKFIVVVKNVPVKPRTKVTVNEKELVVADEK